jgi:phosphatidylglycerol:prolipoprotein diacylglycerol transferase
MLEALIPYIKAPEKTLIENVPLIGPLKLQLFGPLVAIGVVLGWHRGLAWARNKGMDEWFVRDYMWWQILIAFAFGHWVSVIFYFPEQVKDNPWVLVAFWNGLSSVGGFFGGVAAMIVYLKRHKQPILPYLDLSLYGLMLGWCFGRAGCAIVHDHPGQVVDETFLLAVGPWPDGSWRYDLGLYEFFFAVTLTILVHRVLPVTTWAPGRLAGLVVVAYTPFRFGLDFLRATEAARGVTGSPDLRYGGLTTAQWFTIGFFLAGIWLLFLRKPRASDLEWKRAEPPGDAAAPAPAPPAA